MAPKRKAAPAAKAAPPAAPPAKKLASGAPKNSHLAGQQKTTTPGNKISTPAQAPTPAAPVPAPPEPTTPTTPVTPAQATPAQATPAQATPAQATPAQATPAQATPTTPAPAQATPATPAPAPAPPAPDQDTSDDWVPWMLEQGDDSINEYLAQRTQIPESEDWFDEQKKLHQLIWMKGRHPLFPGNWEYNFLMWGLPRRLYRPPLNQKGVAICNRGDEFRATKALEALMDLTIKIADYDWMETPQKIRGLIVHTITNYLNWASGDAGVTGKTVIPVVEVYTYSPDFRLAPDPNNPPAAQPGNGTGDIDALDDIQKDIERKMQELAEKHRNDLEDATDPSGWKCTPPVLFSYTVIHNVVLIVCLDSSDPQARVSVLEQLTLDSASQWLWNALSLAIPINFARDYLYENRDGMANKTANQLNLDDPDA